MIFQIDWIGSKKMKQTFFKFQSVAFLMEGNSCVSFLHTIRLVASLSKQTFPKHVTVTCYETPILYNRTFFSTNLMKNSHSFWTSNFHKECGRFDKKEHFEIVSVFGWKKTYLIINLVALIMMFLKTSIVLLCLTKKN